MEWSRDDERAARAALRTLDGVDGRVLAVLVERCGGAAEAWRAGPRAWPLRPSPARREAWQCAWAGTDPERVVRALHRRGIVPVMPGDPGYPVHLRDGPPLLYAAGELAAATGVAVTIVGTRRMTPYGRRMAHRLAADLAAAGVVVASGLARGVDAAAHEGALSVGGVTVAVLGSGIDRIYPPEHADLARRIRSDGLLLSEHTPDEGPRRHHFPARNRVLAGLALAVVVVEAGVRSGALITALLAAEVNVPVMAVPGPADAWASAGCLQLLREGAMLVTSAADVLEELTRNRSDGVLAALAPGAAHDPVGRPAGLTAEERRLYDVLEAQGLLEPEAAAVHLGWPIQRVWAALAGLEVRGVVARVGGVYVLPGAGRAHA